jgi:hypothetical protein
MGGSGGGGGGGSALSGVAAGFGGGGQKASSGGGSSASQFPSDYSPLNIQPPQAQSSTIPQDNNSVLEQLLQMILSGQGMGSGGY